jgi:SNF2 family DNA or RNA helicase
MPLYEFQKTGVAWLMTGNSILGWDMGLGKTVAALVALDVRRRRDKGLHDALIVTTNSMKFKWAEEAAIWAPSWPSVVVVDGAAEKRRKQILSAPPGSILVCNWESLRLHTRLAGYGSIALSNEERAEQDFNRRPILYVIADEAHRAKDPHAKQTRALWAVAAKARYRWALTGTPVANSPLDLWALLHFMDPVIWASKQAFQDRYVFGIETNWGYEPVGWQQQNKAELFRFVDQYLIRRSKAEVLPQLPEKTYERRLIDMHPKQAKAYKSMKKELMANLDGELLTASGGLVKLVRLSQIASAMPVIDQYEDEAGNLLTDVVALESPSNKVDTLMDILAEGGSESVVVFAASKKLINLAQEALDKKKVSYVRITGDESAEIRSLGVQQFQEGLVRVALCTFGAGSEGITLTRASTAVFLQRPWSLVQSRQAEDRIHRIGQDAEKVLIIDLVSRGTVDVGVHDALVTKGETLESVVRDRARMQELVNAE